jgi:arsenite methyltransferase
MLPMTAIRRDDPWAEWLLHRRFGGDPEAMQRALPKLYEYRDTVLRGARIASGDTVLDIGCGDGLLGRGALPLVGEAGRVIFSDISAELLDRCAEAVAETGATGRCRFVRTGLPDLAEIADGVADVAVIRSVLIYVADKRASFAALHRVLRPGGRLSIFEPVNRFCHPSRMPDRLWGFDVSGLEELAGKVRAEYRRHQPDDDPMSDFDERDLLALAEEAGFAQVRLDYRAEIGPWDEPVTWESLLCGAPNPLVPSGGDVLDAALTPAEQDVLATRIRREAAAGRRHLRSATAYLTATC